jgi:hypothetical protein
MYKIAIAIPYDDVLNLRCEAFNWLYNEYYNDERWSAYSEHEVLHFEFHDKSLFTEFCLKWA